MLKEEDQETVEKYVSIFKDRHLSQSSVDDIFDLLYFESREVQVSVLQEIKSCGLTFAKVTSFSAGDSEEVEKLYVRESIKFKPSDFVGKKYDEIVQMLKSGEVTPLFTRSGLCGFTAGRK